MSFSSETITLGAQQTHPMTTWTGIKILDALIAELPDAISDWQKKALNAIHARDYNLCKVYPALALEDPFVKAIGYMSSIPAVTDKGMPTLATLVTESCRAIVDAHAQMTASQFDEPDDAMLYEARQKAITELQTLTEEIFAKAVK